MCVHVCDNKYTNRERAAREGTGDSLSFVDVVSAVAGWRRLHASGVVPHGDSKNLFRTFSRNM